MRKPIGNKVEWAECLLIIGTGCRVQVFAWSSIAQSVCQQAFSLLVNRYLRSWVRILPSAEEDNLSPFDSNIACLCQSIEINNNKYVYRQSQVRKPIGNKVEWAECLLIIGTGCRVQVFAWSSIAQSVCQQAFSLLVNRYLRSWVRILPSAEEDNLSPFDSNIACLCQSIEINNNKYVYRQSQVRKPIGNKVEWAECLLIIGTGCRVQVFAWSSIAQSVCQQAFSLLVNRYLRSWVRILPSAEEDNLSPFDSNIACLCQSIEINNNKYVYRQSQVRKPIGNKVEWAECLLIIGTGCRVQVFAWSSIAQSVCQQAFSLLVNRYLRSWVRILPSAEEDNLSPFDSNIACLCQSIEIHNNKYVYRQSQVRKPIGNKVEWAECLLIIGTGCRVQVFAWSSIAQSVCQQAFSLLVNRYLRSWVRILPSAEEDNLSPFDSNIACLCQSIEINNNKYVYRQSQVRKPIGNKVEWAECLLIIGTGCRVQVFAWSSIAQSVCLQAFSLLVNRYLRSWVRILPSAEEDNLSPFDSNIACLCQSIEINNNKYVYRQSQVRKPIGNKVEWAECLLIIGTGCRVQVFAWSSIAQSVCQQAFSLLVNRYLRSWVRILPSAEEDNLSPFDSNIACLCQSIEINNNKYVCMYVCMYVLAQCSPLWLDISFMLHSSTSVLGISYSEYSDVYHMTYCILRYITLKWR